MSGWNPYYLAFAATHGRRPAEMVEVEREQWPGGSAAGFILWMSRRWEEWARLRGLRRTANGAGDDLLTEEHHADFAGWLRGRAFRVAEVLTGPVSSELEHEPWCSIDEVVIERGGARRRPCVCNCGARER
jgi:hypothetical protein